MPLFTVMRRGEPPVTIDAPNWIVAMGQGIQQLGGDTAIDRLACEMLPNGTVIARDVRSGVGYVVLPLKGDAPRPPVEDSLDASIPAIEFVDSLDDSLEQSVDEMLERTMDPEDAEVPDLQKDPVLMEHLGRIAGTPGAVTAWELSLDVARMAVKCEAGAAVESTPHAGLLFVAVGGEMADKLRAMRMPYGKGFVGFCIEHGTSLTVSDVHEDSRHYDAVDQATGFSTKAVLCVPVAKEGEVYGCIELINPPSGRFGRADVRRVEVVSEELAERLVRAGVRGRRR
ncbi:MAG TPA: GAF domain-containing protein [Myxococcota bacterium]|nr:GAF domain-containing protein [Myxococcota bacterium]